MTQQDVPEVKPPFAAQRRMPFWPWRRHKAGQAPSDDPDRTGGVSSALHSVFLKLALLIMAAILAVAAALTVMTSGRFAELVDHAVVQQARAETRLPAGPLAASLGAGDSEGLSGRLDDLIVSSEGMALGAAVFDDAGTLLASRGDVAVPRLRDLASRAIATSAAVGDDAAWLQAVPVFPTPDAPPVAALVTAWTTAPLRAETQAIRQRAMWIAALVCLLAMTVATVAIYHLAARPLRDSLKLIGAFRRGDFAAPPPGTRRRDEFGEVARALDDLRHALAAAAAAHRESSFKSAAIDQTSVALLTMNRDFKITQVNPTLAAMFRTHGSELKQLNDAFEPEAVIGMDIAALHPGADIRERLRDVGDEVVTCCAKFKEARLEIATAAIRDKSGDTFAYVVEWRDVTDAWRQRALIDTIDRIQIKAEFSMTGDCVAANAKFDQCFATEAKARLSLDRLLAAPDGGGRSIADRLSAVRAGTPIVGQMTLAAGTGDVIVDGSLSCIRDSDGTGLRYLLLGTDVTDNARQVAAARSEREAAEAEKTEVVEALGVGLRKLSDGDLTASIPQSFSGPYEALRADFNRTAQMLARAMREIAESAENIRNDSGDITATADSLSRRTESTAATLEQTAASLDGLTAALRHAADGAARANAVVAEAHRNAEASGEVVVETVRAMDEIAKSSDQITSIIRVIDDIAFQTNLLALNAGVEAARAGDAGRGFAVVASEVRALAQRSSEAAREINVLIAESGSQVRKGVDLVGQTGTALGEIVASVTEIAALVSRIADSSQTQSTGLEEINAAVTQLDQSTQQNAARPQETTAASEALRNNAVALVNTISHFRTGLGGAPRVAVATRAVPDAAAGDDLSAARQMLSGEEAEWMDY